MPHCEILSIIAKDHRVSGERPRILLRMKQPSGCGVRLPRAQALSVSACSLTVLLFVWRRDLSRPRAKRVKSNSAGGEDYGYFADTREIAGSNPAMRIFLMWLSGPKRLTFRCRLFPGHDSNLVTPAKSRLEKTCSNF
jgi:hypothetical protein